MYQLELQKLKLTASADRLRELSPSAEFTLQTQLAEAESSFAMKQSEMGDVTAQLQDHREVLAALQQVSFLSKPNLHRVSFIRKPDLPRGSFLSKK